MKWLNRECRQQEQVSLLVTGLLAGPEKAALEAHLRTCPQCQRYHQELMQLGQGMSRLKDSVSELVPSASFRARWTALIEGSDSARHKGRLPGLFQVTRGWFSLPRVAFAAGFAAALGVAIVLAATRWHTQNSKMAASALLQNPELIRETLAMFPGRVRAITQDERGLNLVLSDKPNIPRSTPLYVHICDHKHCQSFVTFSGQEIQVAGQKVSVLSDPQGKMILVGENFVWSNTDQAHSRTHLEIEARNLGSVPM